MKKLFLSCALVCAVFGQDVERLKSECAAKNGQSCEILGNILYQNGDTKGAVNAAKAACELLGGYENTGSCDMVNSILVQSGEIDAAIAWHEMRCDAGIMRDCGSLGLLHKFHGAEQKYEDKAKAILSAACEAKNPEACFAYADFFDGDEWEKYKQLACDLDNYFCLGGE